MRHEESTPRKELVLQVPTHSTSAAVAREFNFLGPNMMFSTASPPGNYTIGYGFDLIRLGKAEVMVVGRSDPFSKVAFAGLQSALCGRAGEMLSLYDKNRREG